MIIDKLSACRSRLDNTQADETATAAAPSNQAARKLQHKNAHDGAQKAACNTTANSATKHRKSNPCKLQQNAAEQLRYESADVSGQDLLTNVTAFQQAEQICTAESAKKTENGTACTSAEKAQAGPSAKKRQRTGQTSTTATCEDIGLAGVSSHSKRAKSDRQ